MAMVQKALQSNMGPVLEQVLDGQEVVMWRLERWEKEGSNIIVPWCFRLREISGSTTEVHECWTPSVCCNL